MPIVQTVAEIWRFFDFFKWRLSAVLDLLYACLDHPRRYDFTRRLSIVNAAMRFKNQLVVSMTLIILTILLFLYDISES